MTRSTLSAAALLLVSLAACKASNAPHLGAPESTTATRTAGADDWGGAAESAPAGRASSYGGGGNGVGRVTAADEPAGPPAPVTDARRGEATVGTEVAELQRNKQGLGTAYGEQRSSSVRGTRFERENPYNPDALLSLRYNDAEGVQRIAHLKTGSSYLQPAARQSGGVTLTLRDDYGQPLQAAQVGGEVYAIGEPGTRYTLGLENHTGQRLEVVASVDGLDVIDGGEADFSKRGYVVDPYTSFAIDGWRTSDDTVAAFRFSDMDDSYAGRTGKPRNVGVIGIALFRERGYDEAELHRRDSADPFPNRYAPPPPARPYRGY